MTIIDAKSLENAQNSRRSPYQLITNNGTESGLFRRTLAESSLQKSQQNKRFKTFADVGGT
jgi:hypothetical protein